MGEPADSEARPPPILPPSPAQLRLIAAAFYAILLASGLAWVRLRTGAWLPESMVEGSHTTSLGLGAITAILVVLSSEWLLVRAGWMRWFALEIRRLLGPIDTRTAFQLALLSSVAEELFFRGAMQPVLGYVATSILFGVIHSGPGRRYLAWTGFALVLGFVLGGMLQATGSIWGPVLAHLGINFVNLRRIGRLNGTLRA